jgi:arylamine N-acetyltransferase
MTSPTPPDQEYSPAQISAYLDLINLPPKYRPESKPPHDISFLTALHAHQIAAVPYENLALHYALDRRLSLDPQDLYRKCTTHGRGGYCMEVSVFYYYVLRALGFRVYMAGARIRLRRNGVPEGPYVGL